MARQTDTGLIAQRVPEPGLVIGIWARGCSCCAGNSLMGLGLLLGVTIYVWSRRVMPPHL